MVLPASARPPRRRGCKGGGGRAGAQGPGAPEGGCGLPDPGAHRPRPRPGPPARPPRRRPPAPRAERWARGGPLGSSAAAPLGPAAGAPLLEEVARREEEEEEGGGRRSCGRAGPSAAVAPARGEDAERPPPGHHTWRLCLGSGGYSIVLGSRLSHSRERGTQRTRPQLCGPGSRSRPGGRTLQSSPCRPEACHQTVTPEGK